MLMAALVPFDAEKPRAGTKYTKDMTHVLLL